jgi:hypothetical protein
MGIPCLLIATTRRLTTEGMPVPLEYSIAKLICVCAVTCVYRFGTLHRDVTCDLAG